MAKYIPSERYCPHNQEVTCSEQRCRRCGWNPEENRRRVEALRYKYTRRVKRERG
jgi:hypothetical protein